MDQIEEKDEGKDKKKKKDKKDKKEKKSKRSKSPVQFTGANESEQSPRIPFHEPSEAFLRKEKKKQKKMAKQKLQQAIKNPSFDVIDKYQLQEQEKLVQSVEQSIDDSEMGNALKAHYNQHSARQMDEAI